MAEVIGWLLASVKPDMSINFMEANRTAISGTVR